MTKDKRKLRAQVKSRWYYIFWGTCTVAVCSGQILVGSGFRRMADSFDKVLHSPIELDLGIKRVPLEHWHDDPMINPEGRVY